MGKRLCVRSWQIISLGSFLFLGIAALDFPVTWKIVLASSGTALAVQFAWDKFSGRAFNYKSAFITSLSLALLLRANGPAMYALAAATAITAKFVLHNKSSHFFNPANFSIVVLLLLAPQAVWVSPGQWGRLAFLLILFSILGLYIVKRVRTLNVSLTFLATYATLLFGRALYLGDPLTIPIHQLQSSSLLLFSFFMISDPRTVPSHGTARLVFAALVAVVSYVLAFHYFLSYAIFYALFFVCALNPLFNKLWPAVVFDWHRTAGANRSAMEPAKSLAPVTVGGK